MDSPHLRQRYIILLKKCVQFYHEKSENQSLSYSHMRRVLLFIEEFPQRCFEETGSQLYKYKNIVLGGDLRQIHNYASDPKVQDLECPEKLKAEVNSITDNMVESWKNVTDEENKELVKILLEALNLYLNYVVVEKQKNNNT